MCLLEIEKVYGSSLAARVWRLALWKKVWQHQLGTADVPLKRSHPDVRRPQWPASLNPPPWLIQSAQKRTQPRTLTGIAWTLTFTFSPSALFYTVTNIFTFASSLLLHSLLSCSTETRKPVCLYHQINSQSQPFWNRIILLQHDNRSLKLQLPKKHAQYGANLIKDEVRHAVWPTQMRGFVFNSLYFYFLQII